jgi:hypothetical protein
MNRVAPYFYGNHGRYKSSLLMVNISPCSANVAISIQALPAASFTIVSTMLFPSCLAIVGRRHRYKLRRCVMDTDHQVSQVGNSVASSLPRGRTASDCSALSKSESEISVLVAVCTLHSIIYIKCFVQLKPDRP